MGSAQEIETVALRSADGLTKAEFAPGANMVCCSLQHGGTELLDGGQGLQAYAERGKTMGIPLLYPWANRLAGPGYEAAGKRVSLEQAGEQIPHDPAGLPIHGVLPGLLRWQVEPGSVSDRVVARLDWVSPQLLELFPYAHEVRFTARVREAELEIATTVRATGPDPVPVSFGFHPYLRVPGARRNTYRVSLGAFRRLVLDERMIPTGERVPIERRMFRLEDRSLDDALDGLELPPEFAVSAGGVALTVTFNHGFPFAQVYAPQGHDYICFEPMTAPANALRSGDSLVVLAPGEEHRSAFSIRVSRRLA
jgi:galactose mutarotase-like enzyme